jgi:DNA ligase (NAD+)
MVTGLTNSKNTNPNPEHLKMIRFIAFDMSFPKNQNIELNMTETLTYLVKYGFTIPYNLATPTLTIEWLSSFYQRQKEQQIYDVDGIVIVADRKIKYSERLIRDRNPTYAVAFKEYGDVYETTVKYVEWSASKHGLLKPVIVVEDTIVGDTGFTIRQTTGKNARFIVDNKIGPGARIQVIHNTIPDIKAVITPAEPGLPDPVKYPPWIMGLES